jgi:hypothetical protein
LKGFDLGDAAGNCALIIDGQRHNGCSFALERMDDPDLQTALGFLSGPSEILNQAQRASQVQIERPSGELLDIKVLQVSATGLALIALKRRP